VNSWATLSASANVTGGLERPQRDTRVGFPALTVPSDLVLPSSFAVVAERELPPLVSMRVGSRPAVGDQSGKRIFD
jgi:hypothetical protein